MKRTLILAVVLTAGCAAALTLGVTRASAWDWQSLPTGYSVSNYTTVCHIATDPCVGGEGSTCNHLTIHGASTPWAETDCVNPTFQADLDAFINSTICTVNPAAGGSACAPATTAPPATTTAPVTTNPGATTTQPASTDPAPTTTQADPGTTTIDQSAQIASLQSQIAVLAQQIADLTTQVEKLELASQAGTLAFNQAIANGSTVPEAAEIARGTAMNAVYGLGDFSG